MIELPVIQPETAAPARPRKPDWLRVKLPVGEAYAAVRRLVDEHAASLAGNGAAP